MAAIETLFAQLEGLQQSTGEERLATRIATGRLYVARSGDFLELFIEGSRESFGQMRGARYVSWGEFRDLDSGRLVPALVLKVKHGVTGARLLAHVTYELASALERDPEITNVTLLQIVGPFLSLLLEASVLSTEEQMGLMGELLFLQELLNFGLSQRPAVPAAMVLECWHGWQPAGRDYSGPGIAIECKATAADVRVHALTGMYQVLPDINAAEERVYVFSTGLRQDPSSPFRLIEQVERIEAALPPTEHSSFRNRLRQYAGRGFDLALREHYLLCAGFRQTIAGALFRTDTLDGVLRLSSFIGGAPPSRALRISYDLSLEGAIRVGREERGSVLRGLLNLR
jgi:hypothetical protein